MYLVLAIKSGLCILHLSKQRKREREMSLLTEIKLLEDAIDALNAVEAVTGPPAVCVTRGRLNHLLGDRMDERDQRGVYSPDYIPTETAFIPS